MIVQATDAIASGELINSMIHEYDSQASSLYVILTHQQVFSYKRNFYSLYDVVKTTTTYLPLFAKRSRR